MESEFYIVLSLSIIFSNLQKFLHVLSTFHIFPSKKTWDFPIASSNREDGLKHPWIVTAAAPDPETGREKTIEVEEEMEAE